MDASEKIALAKETLAEAGSYLDAGDAEKATQLIQEAERLVVEITKEQASKEADKAD